MTEQKEELDFEVDVDPYKHLIPVMSDEGDPGDYVEHSEWITLQRMDCDRNFWGLYVDETLVVTFDADQWPTTVDLGGYIDGVVIRLEEQQRSEEEDLDARKAGDDFSSGAFH